MPHLNASPDPSAAAPAPDVDQVVHHLLAGLAWQTSVFHVGQYCGPWRASTSGRSLASFHLVLHGQCHLHVQGQPPVLLGPRDGVFLLRDVPHHLSPFADAQVACAPAPMLPLQPPLAGGTALACGFFHFAGAFSDLLVRSLPDQVLLRAGDADLAPVDALFTLLLDEAGREGAGHSPLIERLVDLLFFYVIRHVARSQGRAGLWSLLRRPGLAPLLTQLLAEPGRAWSADDMARAVHMSRARFFREFGQASGQSPGQFLTTLRMHVAAQRLDRGESVARAAEHVGYLSYAAFSRAFKKTLGEQPGAYQRSRLQAAGRAAGPH